jgi:hypothetical protein
MTSQDSTAVIEQALRLSGFSRLAPVSCTVERVEPAAMAASIPFMATPDSSLGVIWDVRVSGVSLRLPSASPGQRDEFRRDFNIRLAGSRLLDIRSTWHGEDPHLLPRASASHAETQLRANAEKYTGLPGNAPGVDFLQALDKVLSEGSGSPLLAKEIDGLYVMHARRAEQAIPVWVVELRGLPPFPVRGPAGAHGDAQVPVWLRNHMRNILDARTGRVLFANNAPQPSPPNDTPIAGNGSNSSARYG